MSAKPIWYRFYAMFSEEFARGVIESLELKRDSVILDPWLGTGTTTAAAARVGVRSIGFDINPAMVAISLGRAVDRHSASLTLDAVKDCLPSGRGACGPDDPLLDWFGPKTSAALRKWVGAVHAAFPPEKQPWESGFLITCVFDAAAALAKSYRSKNPTWMKRPDPPDRVNVGAADVAKLVTTAIGRRVVQCEENNMGAAAPLIRIGNSSALELGAASVDAVLTSPPYCTRIDYAVSTAVELSVLGLCPQAVSSLRDRMMGTSTIRVKDADAVPGFGARCETFLSLVAKHPGKSSESYYLKNFTQYFRDLRLSVGEIARCLKPASRAVIVAQDSVYKGERIDLPKVLEEMGALSGLRAINRIDFPVTRNMRRVNTRSRSYLSDVSSVETVITFEK